MASDAMAAAGAGLVGGVIGTVGNLVATDAQNTANLSLARYSYEQQKQMIREQNEYNSPVSQMQRYKEAGLNPNLMYGQIQEGNQSEIAKYQAPRLERPDMSRFADIESAIQLALQQKKTEAEIQTQQALTARYQAETYSQDLKNNWEAFISGQPSLYDFEGSRKQRMYDLGLQGEEFSNSLRRLQVDYQQMNNKEKSFFIEYLLPLSLKIKQMEVKGLSYDNAMKKIDAELWRDKRISEINGTPYKIFGRFLDNIVSPGSPTGQAVRKKGLTTGSPLRDWMNRNDIGWRWK